MVASASASASVAQRRWKRREEGQRRSVSSPRIVERRGHEFLATWASTQTTHFGTPSSISCSPRTDQNREGLRPARGEKVANGRMRGWRSPPLTRTPLRSVSPSPRSRGARVARACRGLLAIGDVARACRRSAGSTFGLTLQPDRRSSDGSESRGPSPRSRGEGGQRPDEGLALTTPHPHSASLRVSLSPLARGEGCSRLSVAGACRRSARSPAYGATSSNSNEPGTTGARGRGYFSVAAGASPNFAAGRKM